MLFLKNVLKTSYWTFILSINVLTLSYQLTAQSIPDIPFDVDFAEVTVHMNEQGRTKLRHEVEQLYANRAGLQRDIELLRQLTPLLEPLLKANQLSMDYRYAVLPFMNNDSTGYWCLTPNRALALNMVVNKAVDERYHPILATEAVTAHLSRMHANSGNSVLTLLRYLQDDTLADHVADKANSTYLLLDSQNPLLIWKIIARKLVFEREEPVLRPTQTYLLYEYHNGIGYSVRAISQQLRLNQERFMPFNAWLKAGTIPDEKDYPVLVRVTADEFPVMKSRHERRWKSNAVGPEDVGFPILAKLPPSTVITYESAVFYTINERSGVQAQPCDNVITLAHYGKITIKTLLSYNELFERDVVQPGRVYYLERKAKRAKIPFHIVQKNQTLHEIADVYGVRLKSLLHFNRFQPTQRVQVGRVIWLQKKRPKRRPVEYRQQSVEDVKPVLEETPIVTPPTPVDSLLQTNTPLTDSLLLQTNTEPARPTSGQGEPVEISLKDSLTQEESLLPVDSLDDVNEKLTWHVVKPGQTYYSISQLYGVSLKQLYAWNNLSERIPLKVGKELIVDLTKKHPPILPKPRIAARSQVKPKPAAMLNTFFIEPVQHAVYHIVQAGQTLYRVALINKVSVPDLMRWNNLKEYTIEVGQKLLIRKGR